MTTSADETPIWEVIEEFKEKVKSQESELKKRRDKIESYENELERTKKELETRAANLDAREKDIQSRLADLEPRENAVKEHEKKVLALEKSILQREEEINNAWAEVEKRQVELTRREESIIALSERSAAYEEDIRGMGAHIKAMEESLIKDQERSRQLLEELSSMRENLIAKCKVLADQEPYWRRDQGRPGRSRNASLVGRSCSTNGRRAFTRRSTSTKANARPAIPAEETISLPKMDEAIKSLMLNQRYRNPALDVEIEEPFKEAEHDEAETKTER